MRDVKDILRSNELNTYTMGCYPNDGELYKQMRDDIRTLCDQIKSFDSRQTVELSKKYSNSIYGCLCMLNRLLINRESHTAETEASYTESINRIKEIINSHEVSHV